MSYTSQTTQLLLGQELHRQRWQPLINVSCGQVGSIPASYYKGTVLERRHGDWIFWRRLFMYFLSPYTQNRPVYIELRQGRVLPQPSPFLIHWSPYHSNSWINTAFTFYLYKWSQFSINATHTKRNKCKPRQIKSKHETFTTGRSLLVKFRT